MNFCPPQYGVREYCTDQFIYFVVIIIFNFCITIKLNKSLKHKSNIPYRGLVFWRRSLQVRNCVKFYYFQRMFLSIFHIFSAVGRHQLVKVIFHVFLSVRYNHILLLLNIYGLKSILRTVSVDCNYSYFTQTMLRLHSSATTFQIPYFLN